MLVVRLLNIALVLTSESHSEESDEASSDSSLWDSDVSLGATFKSLTTNLATADFLENKEDDQMPTYPDHWIPHLNS